MLCLTWIFYKVLAEDTIGSLVGHWIWSIWKIWRFFDVDVFWAQVLKSQTLSAIPCWGIRFAILLLLDFEQVLPFSTKRFCVLVVKDLELAKALIRPGSMFLSDLSKADKLCKEKFGTVPRVYVVCKEDKGIPEEFQRWMIQNSEVTDVMEIKDADHMAMFSKPHELFNSLSQIAHKYGWCLLISSLWFFNQSASLSWRYDGPSDIVFYILFSQSLLDCFMFK